MQGSVHTFDPGDDSGSVLLDDGRVVALGTDALLGSGLRGLRVGQRLSLDLVAGDPGTVARVWIVGIGDDARID